MFLLNSRVKTLLVILLFAALAAFWHFGFSGLADGDSLYYIRQADVLRTQGIFNTDFPWAYYSAIRENSSSLWYGFSLFLIPFTFGGNHILGLKIAGVILTTIFLSALYFVVRKLDFKWPAVWPLFAFFGAPNVMAQLVMIRPQTITLILSPVLFYLLVSGRHWIAVFLVTTAISWFHLNFAWAPLFIATVVLSAKFIFERRFWWREFLAVAAGVVVGWLARPNPLGAAKLFYIQVVQQILEKQGGLPLLFGFENYPISGRILFNNFLPFLVICMVAIFLFMRVYYRIQSALDKTILWSALAISSAFFFMTVFVSRRGYNFWVVFGIIFAGMAVMAYLKSTPAYLESSRQATLRFGIGLAMVFLALFSGYKTFASLKETAVHPDRLQAAAEWLADNSQVGDIVFNLHWPDFSELFFSNQKNYYINGLDPIFQYAYNPSLYWKYHYLAIDQVTKKTCGAIECASDMLEDTHQVLKQDFNAKYLILSKNENPLVNFYMENDRNYEKKFSEKDIAVYLIK